MPSFLDAYAAPKKEIPVTIGIFITPGHRGEEFRHIDAPNYANVKYGKSSRAQNTAKLQEYQCIPFYVLLMFQE